MEMSDDLVTNLARIKELTECLKFPEIVPYHKTIENSGTILKDFKNFKKGQLIPIHKEKDFAILVGEMEADFVHQRHTHDEVEILCVLKGKIIVKRENKIEELILNRPVIIYPNTPHEVYYVEETKILAITIPASSDFPTT